MSFLLAAVAGQGGIRVPGAPGTLSLAAGSPDTTVIALSWSAPSDTGGGTISGYKIQYSTNGSSWSNVTADTGSTGTTYNATGLTQNTQYWFRVAGINEAGAGAYGNEPNRTTVAAPITATGGTTNTYSGYKSHYFTSSGTFQITANPNSNTFEVFLMGGGAGSANAGAGWTWCTGGGGGGGMRTATGQTGTVGTFTVTIGAGGTAGGSTAAARGDDTSFAALTVGGGGAGDQYNDTNAAADGGGGGGAGCYFTPNGNTIVESTAGGGTDGSYGLGNGGFSRVWDTNAWLATSGGGGGAGADGEGGQARFDQDGGAGGAGAGNTYRTGATETHAGGGGGASSSDSSATQPAVVGGVGPNGGGNGGFSYWNGSAWVDGDGTDGTANTGGGGGGGCGNATNVTAAAGRVGGSGCVVVRYAV